MFKDALEMVIGLIAILGLGWVFAVLFMVY